MAKKTRLTNEQIAARKAEQDQAFEAFVSTVRGIVSSKTSCEGRIHETGQFYIPYYMRQKAEAAAPNPHLYVQWSPGGVSGGSCWDDSSPSGYTNSDPPPELDVLDAVLEEIKPDLTFLQYKRLTRALVKVESWTEGEYYGNSTDYMVKAVRLRDLYDFLKTEGWLS